MSDGIWSKINTNYKIYPKTGSRQLSPAEDARRYDQAMSGYNLQAKKFKVRTNPAQFYRVTVTALFTVRDVKPGEEVRFRYERSPLEIRVCMRRSYPIDAVR